jgi:hypothetical protein
LDDERHGVITERSKGSIMPAVLACVFIVVGALISTWLTWVVYRRLFLKTKWLRMSGIVTGHVPMDAEGNVAISFRYTIEGCEHQATSQIGSTGFRDIGIGSSVDILVNPADHGMADKDEPIYFWLPIAVFLFGLVFLAAGVFALFFPDGWPP